MFFTGPSHYVVHFHEDKCLACVPKKNILRPNNPYPAVDDDCTVLWSDGSEYTATVVAMGKFGVLILQMYMYTCVLRSIQYAYLLFCGEIHVW